MTCGRKIGPFDCCSVVQGDCLELMKQLPDGCVDAVITDPPYGFGAYETDGCGFTCALAHAVLKWPSSAVFGYPEQLIGWCVENGLYPDEWLTWWPTNAACKGSNGAGLRRESEHVAIFGKCNRIRGREYSSETLKMGHLPHKERGGFIRSEEGAIWGDVWTDAAPGLLANSHLRLHPNEKPLEIMLRLAKMFAADTILDPFAGSGTTLVAAKKLGRHFLGFEISPEYCEIARKRLDAIDAQPTLFEPKPEQLTLEASL